MNNSDTGVIQLDSLDAFKTQACVLLQSAVREVRIVSSDLELSLYGDTEVFACLRTFVTTNRHARLDIIVASDKELVGVGHPVLDLSRRLTSSISIEVLEPDYVEAQKPFPAFMLIDRRGLLYRPDCSRYAGFAHGDDVAAALRLREQYDELKRLSKPSREAKRLYI